jgi:F1F0 ATPase subunit 2
MNELDLVGLGFAFVAGALLGSVFFAGLWLTVKRLPGASSPYRLYLWSLVFRMLLVLAGFYLLALRGIGVLLSAGLGFVMARQVWLFARGRWTAVSIPVDQEET